MRAVRGKVSIVLPDLSGGGAERLHVNLANDWADRGLTVEIVLLQKRGELIPLVSPRVSLVECPSSRIRFAPLSLCRYLRKARPDVILSAMWPLTCATTIAWLLSGRRGHLFLSDHNQLSISCLEELRLPLFYLKWSMRLTYPFAAGVIAVSKGVKDDQCKLAGLAPELVEVIYNPASTGASHHRESKATQDKLWGAGFDYHILSVGTLKPVKDHETLIRAIFNLPSELNVKLTILGEGILRGRLEGLIRELGLENRISLPGFLLEPSPWYRSADLFVLSSRWEGFGNVIVEALECGVPVVSTDCPSGPAEILEDGRYGKLVPIGDPYALAVAINESLVAPHKRECLIQRARAFSVPVISAQYLKYCFAMDESN